MAREFAGRGYHLALLARSTGKLDELANSIKATQPQCQVHTAYLDVCDISSIEPALAEARSKLGQLDIVIANAGVALYNRVGSGKLEGDMLTLQTNVQGAIATIDCAASLFRKQGHGQLVAISSVAAARGLPGFGAYAASKAALATYMESVAAEFHGSAIQVTTLFPGYIDTPLNQSVKNRPFVIDVEKGGKILVDLIERGVKKSTVPVFPWNLLQQALKLAPTALLKRL